MSGPPAALAAGDLGVTITLGLMPATKSLVTRAFVKRADLATAPAPGVPVATTVADSSNRITRSDDAASSATMIAALMTTRESTQTGA